MPVKLSKRLVDSDVHPTEVITLSKPRPRTDTAPPRARRSLPTGCSRWYPACRAVGDVVLALMLLVLAAPVIVLTAIVVKLTSRGPAFYTQTRVGKDGRLFTIYKIRTMVNQCESLTGPRWAIPDDPRVTRMGQFLRASHLDELPQLVNVLRGEMSLVGPRPERPEFIPELERAIPWYRERLAVRPGVTGLAQVHLPGDTDVGCVRRKLTYDLFYIARLSPGLDLRILVCTALKAAGVPFPISRRLLQMPSAEAAEHVVQATRLEAATAGARCAA